MSTRYLFEKKSFNQSHGWLKPIRGKGREGSCVSLLISYTEFLPVWSPRPFWPYCLISPSALLLPAHFVDHVVPKVNFNLIAPYCVLGVNLNMFRNKHLTRKNFGLWTFFFIFFSLLKFCIYILATFWVAN